MRRFNIYLFAAVVAILAVGCASNRINKQQDSDAAALFSPLDRTSAAILQDRAEKFTQAMLRSFQTGDFKYWKDSLRAETPAGSLPVIDEKKFRMMQERLTKQWGKLVKCHYLGSLDQSLLRDYIWKCTFESEAGQGKVVRLEELFVVRCTLLKGKTTFTGFGFRFFNRAGFRDQVIKIKKAEVKNEKTN